MQEDARQTKLGQPPIDNTRDDLRTPDREGTSRPDHRRERLRPDEPARHTAAELPHAPLMEKGARPFVAIVMPALNEEKYIENAILSVLPAKGDLPVELLVMDGGSTDETRAIVSRLAAHDPRIRLVHNEGRIQSAGVNLAARIASPQAHYMVRADCHAVYPPGFVRQCIDTIIAHRATSVVIAMRTRGRSLMQSAIAAAQNSRLGNGGSAHRRQGMTGFVDHGHHAAFDRAAFRAVGGYDESCPYNEDAELDKRIVSAGGRIYLNGNIAIDYFPRDRLSALARQYANHGWGRANTLIKHGGVPQIRQVLPVLVLLGSAAGLVLGLSVHPVFLFVPTGYIAAACLWGAFLAIEQRALAPLMSGPAAIVMHMAWASGFLKRFGQQAASVMLKRFANARPGAPPVGKAG